MAYQRQSAASPGADGEGGAITAVLHGLPGQAALDTDGVETGQ